MKKPTNTRALEFLSTLSLRRATDVSVVEYKKAKISIHALLAESDFQLDVMITTFYYFYPRSPCGERLDELCRMMGIKHFYPRSPCGERPKIDKDHYVDNHFYPRSPCGERRCCRRLFPQGLQISIHALLAESDDR